MMKSSSFDSQNQNGHYEYINQSKFSPPSFTNYPKPLDKQQQLMLQKTFQVKEQEIEDLSPENEAKKEKKGEEEESAQTNRNRASMNQKSLLERIFQTNQYPDLTLRTQLAKELNMSPRKVQIWFQNRRTKAKNQHNESSTLLYMVDVSDINKQEPVTGNTLLIMSCATGHPAVQYLLSRGANCNLMNAKGWTAIYAATWYQHDKVVDMLLAKRFNCNVNVLEFTYGQSPLHVAAIKGFETISLLLLSKAQNLQVNIRDYEGRTPLHHAAIYGFSRIVKQLLNAKADVNIVSKDGFTPLHCCSLTGQLDVTQMLLEYGVYIDLQDIYGYTALMFAVREQHVSIVNLLLRNGVNVRIGTNTGVTALHFAAMSQNIQIIKMLLDAGADPFASDCNGNTAVDYARLFSNFQAYEFLSIWMRRCK